MTGHTCLDPAEVDLGESGLSAVDEAAIDRDLDERLARRIAAGDDLALTALYDKYSSIIFSVALRVTGSLSGAEDVTQDSFASLWERIERFDIQRGTLKAFLCTIAYRRAVDWVRREARSRERTLRAGAAPPVEAPGSADGWIDPDDGERLRHAVAELPSDQRAAVFLAYYRGFTYREVATHLGVPEGTAKSRLRLALARLRAALGEGGGDHGR